MLLGTARHNGHYWVCDVDYDIIENSIHPYIQAVYNANVSMIHSGSPNKDTSISLVAGGHCAEIGRK